MQWQFADLSVASDVPLPDLPRTSAPPDIVIERRPLPDRVWTPIQTWGDEGEISLSIERGASEYRLTFPDLVCVVSADGTRVICAAAPAEEKAAHLLMHQVLPLAISRRGRMVLHACAVESPDGTVALLGDSGAGKSTLAAALCARGLALVADDALVVDLEGGAHTWPTAGGLRLWEDVAVAWPAFPIVAAPPGGKRRVRVPLASGRAPLARIFLMGEVIADGVDITPISPARARMEILPHLFRLDVTSEEESRVLFDRVHTLCERVTVRRIAYPDGVDRIDAVAGAVLEDLERT